MKSNKIATVLNNIHHFKIPAHRLHRSRSAQEINKHVSDGVRAENKPKTAKTKEAKDFSKSEAELVDAMDSFQRTYFNHREGDSQEPFLLVEGNRHTDHEQRHGSGHHGEDLNVNSLQRTVSMMEAYHRADHRRFMRKHSRSHWDRTVLLKL